jgi:hypothetical protein
MNLPLTLLTTVADEYYVPMSLPHLSYLLPHPSPLTQQPQRSRVITSPTAHFQINRSLKHG